VAAVAEGSWEALAPVLAKQSVQAPDGMGMICGRFTTYSDKYNMGFCTTRSDNDGDNMGFQESKRQTIPSGNLT